jgi:hypothetical protein
LQPAAKPDATEVGVRVEENVADDIPGRRLDTLARDLPLDPATRDLSDAIPVNAGSIERRLGLRRTRVVGIDMRERTPSPMEIVQALAPRASAER